MGDDVVSSKGEARIGVTGDATWNVTQNCSLCGGAQLFSRDISLRALNAGITANSYDLTTGWTKDQIRDVNAQAEFMNFSDDNFRLTLLVSDAEHFYVGQYFLSDGIGNVVGCQNSKNENRPYFNPEQDKLGMAGGKIIEPLYDDGHYIYRHSLAFTPGVYWQENYGSSPALEARYDQTTKVGRNFDLGAWIDFIREDAEHSPQNTVTFLANITKRF